MKQYCSLAYLYAILPVYYTESGDHAPANYSRDTIVLPFTLLFKIDFDCLASIGQFIFKRFALIFLLSIHFIWE